MFVKKKKKCNLLFAEKVDGAGNWQKVSKRAAGVSLTIDTTDTEKGNK